LRLACAGWLPGGRPWLRWHFLEVFGSRVWDSVPMPLLISAPAGMICSVCDRPAPAEHHALRYPRSRAKLSFALRTNALEVGSPGLVITPHSRVVVALARGTSAAGLAGYAQACERIMWSSGAQRLLNCLRCPLILNRVAGELRDMLDAVMSPPTGAVSLVVLVGAFERVRAIWSYRRCISRRKQYARCIAIPDSVAYLSRMLSSLLRMRWYR